MRALSIIGVDERAHGIGSVLGGFIGSGVGPFAEQGLNEALSFAIGSWRIRPCADMADPGGIERIAEGAAFIGRAVIGHDAFWGDAIGPEESA